MNSNVIQYSLFAIFCAFAWLFAALKDQWTVTIFIGLAFALNTMAAAYSYKEPKQ